MLRQVTPPATETAETSYKDLTEAITKALRLFEDPAFILLQGRVEFLEGLRDRINGGLQFRGFVEAGCETVKQDGESTAAKMYRAVDSLIAGAIQDGSTVAYNGINSTVAHTDRTNADRNLDACAVGMARIFKPFAHYAITTQINTETSSAEIIDRIQQDIANIITLTKSLQPFPEIATCGQFLEEQLNSDNFTTLLCTLDVKRFLPVLAAFISSRQVLQTRDTSPQDLESENNSLPTLTDPAWPLNQNGPEEEPSKAGDDVNSQPQEPDSEPDARHAEAPAADETVSPSESNEPFEGLDTSDDDTIATQCEIVGLGVDTVREIFRAANKKVTRQGVLQFVAAFERIKDKIEAAGLSSEKADEHALYLIQFGWTQPAIHTTCEVAPKIVRKSRALGIDVKFTDASEGLRDLLKWNATLGKELKAQNDEIRDFLEQELRLQSSQVESVIYHLTQAAYPTSLAQINERVTHLRELYLCNLERNVVSLSDLVAVVDPSIIMKCMGNLFQFTEEGYETFRGSRGKSLSTINGKIDSADSDVCSLLLRAITYDDSAQHALVEKAQQNPEQNPTEHNTLPEQNDQVGRVKMVLQRLYHISDERLDDAAKAVTYLGKHGGTATSHAIIKYTFNNRGERAQEIEEELREKRLISIKHGGGNKLTLEATPLIQAALDHRIETGTLHTRLQSQESKMEKTHE